MIGRRCPALPRGAHGSSWGGGPSSTRLSGCRMPRSFPDLPALRPGTALLQRSLPLRSPGGGQRRRANERHQRSPEGKLDHRDRQRRYRHRRARVTDQGSVSIFSPASCGCGTPETPPVTARPGSGAAVGQRCLPEMPPVPFLRCVVCGRKGRFVDPFPRYPRCGRRNS